MKKTIVTALCLMFSYVSFAQVDIDEFSKMEINAQTQDWWSALKVKVSTTNSGAFNLWNNIWGRDVSFFIANGWLYVEQGYYTGSDTTLKRNIQPIDAALEKVMQLNGVRYQYKPNTIEEEEAYDTIAGNGYRFGLLAQEVEQVLPEVVTTFPDGRMAVSYTDFIAILIEAVKQQQKEIDTLKQALIDNNLMGE